jgi:hypothetical protein
MFISRRSTVATETQIQPRSGASTQGENIMAIRTTLAAAALSTVALLSGTAFAGDFASDLSEAKVASQTTGRETREAVTPALNAAQSFNAWGNHAQAQGYLNYARGMLGLPTSAAIVATPVVAAPIASFDQQVNEAKAANANATREIRETVAIHLNAVEGLEVQGKHDQAQAYLNFARGKLGLQVPATQTADAGDIVSYRPEAR